MPCHNRSPAMCLPRTVRVLESDALPIVQEQGWFAPMPNDWNGGFVDFMLEQDDDGFIPNGAQEDAPDFIPNGTQEGDADFIPHDIEEEFGQIGLLSDNDTIATDYHGNTLDDFGEYGLLGPDDDDIERMRNVYAGVERPRDDDDWYACWKYCTDSLFYVTGLTYEFHQWESAWPDSDDSSSD